MLANSFFGGWGKFSSLKDLNWLTLPHYYDITCSDRFCVKNVMTINLKKTEAAIFPMQAMLPYRT